jgi:spermidine dehydrogenase
MPTNFSSPQPPLASGTSGAITPQGSIDLGCDQPIARRDFLNGIVFGIAGASVSAVSLKAAPEEAGTAGAASAGSDVPPPERTGLRGNYPAAIVDFDAVQNGEYARFPVPDEEMREEFDLAIVGGGISGLAAAYFYRKALGPEGRILILDNHDDFGGHAKKNEFHYEGKTYIGVGGTLGISTPFPYSYTAKSLIQELGIAVDRNSEFANRELETKYGLKSGYFFDKEHFTEDRIVVGNPHQKSFFSKLPLSEEAQRDLARLHGKNPDYMPGLTPEQKQAKLARMSYEDFLLSVAKVHRQAAAFFLAYGGRNNKRVDTTPALEAAEHDLPGFNGLNLPRKDEFNEGSYQFHFPDGNASVARLLVSKLVPSAFSAPLSMDTATAAHPDYSKLDTSECNTRIRLGSTAVRVQNAGDPEQAQSVRIAYRKAGTLCGVRAQNCILACYNGLIPSLMPEISVRQKKALGYPAKVPLVYTNVLVKRWTAFQKLGVSRISSPGMYYSYINLDPGTTIGGYQGMTTPDQPIVVHMMANPNKPGLPRKEQNRVGQRELLSMSFADFERKTREQLHRMLSPGGFQVADDIAAITVNRWPFGYAYTYDTLADPDLPPQEERPHVIGRSRLGRVAIANSDAGAAAFTNQAIDEANRAVQELLVHQGLT